MLTGHSPFRAETTMGVLNRIGNDQPRSLRSINADIPEWLEQIVMKLLAKPRDDRFQTASEVAELLEDCLAHVQQPTTTPLPDAVAKLAKSIGSDGSTTPAESLGDFRYPPIGKLIATAAFAFSLIFAGVLIVLELNKGTLTIQSDVDGVPIRIVKGKETVRQLTVNQSGETIRIAVGEYVVMIEGPMDAIAVKDGQVAIHRGENEVVSIVHTEGAADAALDSQTEPVDFVLGKSNLKKGDQIEIQSVTTSGIGFEVGATVTVKGTYTLDSEDAANLCFFSTTKQKAGETPTPTPIQPSQQMKAKRGKHAFTLSKVIGRFGSLHVSFYHPTTGNGMGGVYFSKAEEMPDTGNIQSSGESGVRLSADGWLDTLQGGWNVVQESREEGELKRHSYTASIRGKRMEILGNGMHAMSLDFDIGALGPPRHIDMRLSDRDRQKWMKGVSDNDSMKLIYYGIIESDGTTLRICNHGAPGNPRPTRFTDSDGYLIWNFTRGEEKKVSSTPKIREAILSPQPELDAKLVPVVSELADRVSLAKIETIVVDYQVTHSRGEPVDLSEIDGSFETESFQRYLESPAKLCLDRKSGNGFFSGEDSYLIQLARNESTAIRMVHDNDHYVATLLSPSDLSIAGQYAGYDKWVTNPFSCDRSLEDVLRGLIRGHDFLDRDSARIWFRVIEDSDSLFRFDVVDQYEDAQSGSQIPEEDRQRGVGARYSITKYRYRVTLDKRLNWAMTELVQYQRTKLGQEGLENGPMKIGEKILFEDHVQFNGIWLPKRVRRFVGYDEKTVLVELAVTHVSVNKRADMIDTVDIPPESRVHDERPETREAERTKVSDILVDQMGQTSLFCSDRNKEV
ncbi:MAG: hypothetical protein WBD31_05135, partial [Rubripirellula sp.]